MPDGWRRGVRLTITAGSISAIEVDAAAQPDDEQHAFAVPGVANVHSHAFQRAMAGLAERRGPGDDNFWSWREAMYRFGPTIPRPGRPGASVARRAPDQTRVTAFGVAMAMRFKLGVAV